MLTSLFTVAATAAAERRQVFTADVKGAFLNGMMPDDKVVDMILDPQMSKILCDQRQQLNSRSTASLCLSASPSVASVYLATNIVYH